MEFVYNINTRYYYTYAKKLHLPVEIVDPIQGFVFRLGKKSYFFRGAETSMNGSAGDALARNKYAANKILERGGVPVPKATAVHIDQFQHNELAHLLEDLSFPLVVKPLTGARGKDVICNISDMALLKKVMANYFLVSREEWVCVEEFHGNLNSYRILVFKGKILGVVQRYAAHVIGDGQHTIRELVELTNHQRKQISFELAPIMFDDECDIALKQQGVTPDYVPTFDERIVLCYTCNATRGGSYAALSTRVLCRQNRRLFLEVNALLGLNFSGIDVECVDLNIPIVDSRGVVIEVNPGPSIKIHEQPQAGKPNQVAKKVIRSILYRHPLSYLHILYQHHILAPYIRGLMILMGFGLLYKVML